MNYKLQTIYKLSELQDMLRGLSTYEDMIEDTMHKQNLSRRMAILHIFESINDISNDREYFKNQLLLHLSILEHECRTEIHFAVNESETGYQSGIADACASISLFVKKLYSTE